MIDLVRNWWVLLLQGVAAVVLGVLALVWPGLTATSLVLLLGAYLLITGVVGVVGAVRRSRSRSVAPLRAVWGVLSIVAGTLALVWPGAAAVVLLYVVAGWGIAIGIVLLVAALALQRVVRSAWLLVAGGVVCILLGVVLIAFPGAGVLSVTWVIAAVAIVLGVLLVVLSLRLRGAAHRTDVVRVVR